MSQTNKELAHQVVEYWFLREGRGIYTSDTISDYYKLMDDIEELLNRKDKDNSLARSIG